MNFTTRAKALVGAVAIGGATIAMGGAFTAGGLTTSGATGGFVGGTATQSIQGATLVSSTYDVDDVNHVINSVTLNFAAGANGKGVKIAFSTGSTQATQAYTCGAVTNNASTCTPAVADAKASSSNDTLKITVESETA